MNTGGTIVAERGNIPSIESKNSTTSSYARVYLSQTSGSGGYFAINKLGTTSTAIGGANATQLWASGDAPMLFATNNAERLRIDSSGNLIVNNTSAAAGGYTYKLLASDQITSSEQTFGIQYLGTVTYGLNAESNGSFTIKKDGTERLRIDSSGHVGIGTDNPSGSLQGAWNKVLVISAGSNNGSMMRFIESSSANGGSNTGMLLGQYSNDSYLINYQSGFMSLRTNNAERLRIRSDGKISTGTSLNTTNGYEFSITGSESVGCFYAHGRNHYLSNRSNAYASLTLKKSNADSDGTDYLQLRNSSNALKLALTGDGSISGDPVKVKISGSEKLRVNSGSVWVIGGTSGMPTSSSGARLQVGAHTFTGSNHVYHTSRLGIQNNGSLTCISNCSTYTDVTYPGYGFVMVQGASTSDYNTFGICPDSPQTGSDLNFHAGYRKSNIHSDSGVRQMWLNFSGQVYKRDNGANWNQTSDERLKKNIVDNNIGLAEIKKLRITSFEYRKADEIDMSLFPKANDPLQVIIEGEEGPHTGVIAQEIESVLPECVKTSDKGAKTVQADAITWALVNAVKELSAKNDALEERIKNLEGS